MSVIITPHDLARILAEPGMNPSDGEQLRRALEAQGVNPWHIFQAKAYLAGMRAVDLEKHRPEPHALSRVPAAVLRRQNVVPVTVMLREGTREEVLVLAVADAANIVGLDAVREACGCKVQPVLATPEQVAAALAALDTAGD